MQDVSWYRGTRIDGWYHCRHSVAGAWDRCGNHLGVYGVSGGRVLVRGMLMTDPYPRGRRVMWALIILGGICVVTSLLL